MPERDVPPDHQPTANHRAVLLRILPLAALASLIAVLLEPRAQEAAPFDLVAYPLALGGVLGLYGALLLRPAITALVADTLVWGFSAFFLLKLTFLMFVNHSAALMLADLSESFFWTPALFLLTFTTSNLRRSQAVNVGFLCSLAALSCAYLLTRSEAPDARMLSMLAQLNFANLACFLLTGLIHQMAWRQVSTAERARALEQLAHTDALTGLPNRRSFEQSLRAHLAATAAPMTVLFFDLNGFKAINDRYGHETGDLVLACIAERLRATFRSGEVFARLSGDEFAGLIASADPAVVRAVLRRVEDLLAEPITVSGAVLTVSASAGTSEYPRDGQDVMALLRHADARMYAAKRASR
ncbi:GGDEF domain-containing protein (plasmid) [Deinococcus taeanensis]|uniref:GGDEF domain-containing protein n=1 Tax=Deinococcus taeanensis TaxID=2737050 RepID=UPI001CDBE12D|nr:GGDEF domain-containing protein [Deinococcus taeanensis]UBV44081.1 GGDEF domain-containing protein [Deinococcus taeanensis]